MAKKLDKKVELKGNVKKMLVDLFNNQEGVTVFENANELFDNMTKDTIVVRGLIQLPNKDNADVLEDVDVQIKVITRANKDGNQYAMSVEDEE